MFKCASVAEWIGSWTGDQKVVGSIHGRVGVGVNANVSDKHVCTTVAICCMLPGELR